MLPLAANVILVTVLIAAAYTDVKRRRIANRLTVPAIGAGILLSGVNGGPWGALSSLGATAIAFAMLIVPWLVGAVGGGDTKFFMAVGALKGWPFILTTAWYSALAAGVLALVMIIRQRSFLATVTYLISPALPNAQSAQTRAMKPAVLSTTLPAGLAIALGALAALFLEAFNK